MENAEERDLRISAADALDAGMTKEAVGLFRQACDVLERADGPDSPDLAMALNRLGRALVARGDVEEARVRQLRALAILLAARGTTDDRNVATILADVGRVFRLQGYPRNAVLALRRAVKVNEAHHWPDDRVENLRSLGLAHRAMGNAVDGAVKLREAVDKLPSGDARDPAVRRELSETQRAVLLDTFRPVAIGGTWVLLTLAWALCGVAWWVTGRFDTALSPIPIDILAGPAGGLLMHPRSILGVVTIALGVVSIVTILYLLGPMRRARRLWQPLPDLSSLMLEYEMPGRDVAELVEQFHLCLDSRSPVSFALAELTEDDHTVVSGLVEVIAELSEAVADASYGVAPVAHRALADTYRMLGDLAAAATEYQLLIDQDDQDVSALSGRGEANLALGRLDEAVADIDAALATDPRRTFALSLLEEALQRGGRRRSRPIAIPTPDSRTGVDIVRERRRKSQDRRRAVAWAALILITCGAVTAAIAERRDADGQARIAIAGAMIAQAEAEQETSPILALRLAIAADHLSPGPETRRGLLRFLSTSHFVQSLTGVPSPVDSVAFAPQGRLLATECRDGTVTLWDAGDPRQPRELSGVASGQSNVVYAAIAINPAGRLLAATGMAGITLWDITDPSRPRQAGSPIREDRVSTLAFDPDGRILATGSEDHPSVVLWDVSDPARPAQAGLPLPSAPVATLAYSPDGRTLAGGILNGGIVLWDATNPEWPRTLDRPQVGGSDWVNSVAFSPNGQVFASGDGNLIRLWDAHDPSRVLPLGQPLQGHGGAVQAVAFSPDGRTLATGARDDSVILWDVTDPASPHRLDRLTGHGDWVLALAFSPDGHTLASGGQDQRTILWDASPDRPRQLGTPLTVNPNAVNAVSFRPDGRVMATAGGSPPDGVASMEGDNSVILWDTSNPARPHRLGSPLTGHQKSVTSVVFSCDGRTLATAGADGVVILWDVTDPEHPHQGSRLLGQSNPAFSPTGHILATGSSDSTVGLWNITAPAQASQIGSPLTGHSNTVTAVAFSRDGRLLATAGGDQVVILWGVSKPMSAHQLSPQLGVPHGRVFMDVSAFNSVQSMAFSPDGRTLVLGTWDGTLSLLDTSDPSAPRLMGPPLVQHTATITSVAFSPDGRALATASSDHTAILWDARDRRHLSEMSRLTAHTGAVLGLAFRQSGHVLATSGDDHTVILWDTTAIDDLRDHLEARACALAGQGLDETEWVRATTYPFERTC